MFFGSKVNKYPQDFLDAVYKIFYPMGVSSNEKVELATYQLKGVAQTWHTQWKEIRLLEKVPYVGEYLGGHFLIGSYEGRK